MPVWKWRFWPDVDRMKGYANDTQNPSKVSILLRATDDICTDYAIDLTLTKRLQLLLSAGIVFFVGEIVFWIVGLLR